MGLMDHKRTWRYRVHASPRDCITQFTTAFKTGGLMVKGNWDVSSTSNKAVATYLGLGGAGQVLRAMSKTAQGVEAGAVGSKVIFEANPGGGEGCTECAMWLSEHGTRMGFTNDAGVIRRHMQAVQKHLQKIDTNLRVVKD
jgi:hypothetical protein